MTTDLVHLQAIEHLLGFIFQLALGSLNAVMIYRLTKKLLSNGFFGKERSSGSNNEVQAAQERIARGAGIFYVYSQTLVYTISNYSEPLFTFLQLAAMMIMHYGYDNKLQNRRLIIAMPLLGLSTATRATGCFTALIPCYFTLHKLVRNWFELKIDN